MMTVPTGRVWRTQDGRVLDIHWMDTLHLVRTLNMLIRQNHLDKDRVERIRADKNAHFVTMREELKNRGAYAWTREWYNSESFEQLHVIDVSREDIKTLCMMRAMLDTNIFWPPKSSPVRSVANLREKGQTVLDAIHKAAVAEPRLDLHRLLAKFAEYRLERS